MPLYRYLYADGTLERLFANHVDWRDVEHVLKSAHPAVREHIGVAVLRIIARDRRGDLLMVTCIEDAIEDDVFSIHTARYLDPAESEDPRLAQL